MKETLVLDASALIAFLGDEDGADKVEDFLQKAKKDTCDIYMNKLNVLEIYYGIYRAVACALIRATPTNRWSETSHNPGRNKYLAPSLYEVRSARPLAGNIE